MKPEWEIFYSFLPIISSYLSNFSPYFLVFSNIFENLYGCIILCFGFYAQCAKLSKIIYQNRAKIFITCHTFFFALIVQSDYLCNSPATRPDSSLGVVHWQWLCEWSSHKTTENDLPHLHSPWSCWQPYRQPSNRLPGRSVLGAQPPATATAPGLGSRPRSPGPLKGQ